MRFGFSLSQLDGIDIKSFWDTIRMKLLDIDLWVDIFWTIVQILFIWILAKLLIKLTGKIIEKFIIRKPRSSLKVDERRTKTLGILIQNIVKYTINFLAILMILGKVGFNLGPILAGAGILGLAIGFGAQSLVKDVITGFFIIFEDQFAVGDYITTGNFSGTVEEIGLRITKIRNWTGELHIIPNGTISEVTNYSTHNSVAVVDVGIAYEEEIDHVISVLEKLLANTYKEMNEMVKPPEILGVQELGASEVVIRVIAETKPMNHYAVARKLRAKIKNGFDQAGIEIPYPRLVTFQKTKG
ncbi:mechanosensitive ion channel family protein [Tepidibacillus sp. HK-1]|uniref:mechanosensitive ion channel family protein n=1 Tax=Tepidibacillus sp. HK-1 TaxID=1883407 RepID=UPI0008538CD1|nr:mechanosensitive ion channel family protein [Tepidibacillus sp. HK-1]GBF11545.1 putative MscS family protein YkuT [Tepidibacillus sp. HK-1]